MTLQSMRPEQRAAEKDGSIHRDFFRWLTRLIESLNTDETNISTLQADVATAQSEINALEAKAITQGVHVTSISLSPFADNVINHGLGREPLGWVVTYRERVACAFRAYRNAAGNVATGNNLMDFDAEDYDDGSVFDTSTDKFTAPVDGLYQFDWSLHVTAATAGNRVTTALGKNGSTAIARGSIDIVGSAKVSGSVGAASLRLSTDDTIEVRTAHDDAGSLALSGTGGNGHNYLQGRLVDEGITETDRDATSLTVRCSYAHDINLWVF